MLARSDTRPTRHNGQRPKRSIIVKQEGKARNFLPIPPPPRQLQDPRRAVNLKQGRQIENKGLQNAQRGQNRRAIHHARCGEPWTRTYGTARPRILLFVERVRVAVRPPKHNRHLCQQKWPKMSNLTSGLPSRVRSCEASLRKRPARSTAAAASRAGASGRTQGR